MNYLFADEAGNFDFSPKGSRYYIVTAVTMPGFEAGIQLLHLRHKLAYEGAEIAHDGFHASEERQNVRDRVFPIISSNEIKIDAVVIEKRKTEPRIAASEHYFYRLAWSFLFQHIVDKSFPSNEPGLIVAGALATKKKLENFRKVVVDVASQHRPADVVKAVSWSASSHPCLQIADYCCWAIQRRYEKGCNMSYNLIEPKIRSCFEPFVDGKTSFY